MQPSKHQKILFIVNPQSGRNNINWKTLIEAFFHKNAGLQLSIFELQESYDKKDIEREINSFSPDVVAAVGGDGTVKLVAECLLGKSIALGIIPGGSANGLAKELGISEKPETALGLLLTGIRQRIHVIRVNEHLCVHLSDIGFNAYLIKKFDDAHGRGMWGYLKASLKAIANNPMMDVCIIAEGKPVRIKAAMIVIANATRYGTGAVINPVGTMDDGLFEVIVLKKLSVSEIFKMTVFKIKHNPVKTAVYQTSKLTIMSRAAVHFQVDGEYLGKVHKIAAAIVPDALEVIVPPAE